jgi:hypothetical protein
MGLLAAGAVEIRAEAFPTIGPMGAEIGCMAMTSGHVLYGDDRFGGYSGLALDPQDGTLTALSDRASILRAHVALDDGGRVTSIRDGRILPVLGPKGGDLPRGEADIEELKRFGDGWLMTREGIHDVVTLSIGEKDARLGERLVDLSDTEPLDRNKGFEAAASLGGSSWLFLTEAKTPDGLAAGRIWDGGGAARNLNYRPAEDFAVTAAARGGAFVYVLERAFDRRNGPRARLSRFPARDAVPGAVIVPDELARFGFLEGADNMEGLAFYTARDRSENLILISDDNFNDFQRTVLITMRLGAGCGSAPPETAPGTDQSSERGVEQ